MRELTDGDIAGVEEEHGYDDRDMHSRKQNQHDVGDGMPDTVEILHFTRDE